MHLLLCLVLNIPVMYMSDGSMYNYFENGNDWENYCPEGYRQSPIDITDGIIRECERISMKLFLNDSVNEVMFSLHDSHFRTSFISGPLAMIEATDILERKQYYVLKHYKSIHFHSPGEHLINHKQPDLSMHMVFHRVGPITHEDHYAVIEIMFEKTGGQKSKLAGDEFLEKLSIQHHHKNVEVNFADLLKDVIAKPDFYHYKGSLTTPPCNEIVSWFVYKYPLQISPSTIEFLEDVWVNNQSFSGGRGNYRLTQYLNGRKVFYFVADIAFGFEEPTEELFLNSKKLISIIYSFILLFIIIY